MARLLKNLAKFGDEKAYMVIFFFLTLNFLDLLSTFNVTPDLSYETAWDVTIFGFGWSKVILLSCIYSLVIICLSAYSTISTPKLGDNQKGKGTFILSLIGFAAIRVAIISHFLAIVNNLIYISYIKEETKDYKIFTFFDRYHELNKFFREDLGVSYISLIAILTFILFTTLYIKKHKIK